MEEAGRSSVGPGSTSDRAVMVSEGAGWTFDRAGRVSNGAGRGTEEAGNASEGAKRALRGSPGRGMLKEKKKKQITEYFPKCGGATGHLLPWVHCPKTPNNV